MMVAIVITIMYACYYMTCSNADRECRSLCCLFHWNPPLQAHSKNKSGKTREARKYGFQALGWNIAVIIYHVILWIVLIIFIAVSASR